MYDLPAVILLCGGCIGIVFITKSVPHDNDADLDLDEIKYLLSAPGAYVFYAFYVVMLIITWCVDKWFRRKLKGLNYDLNLWI